MNVRLFEKLICFCCILAASSTAFGQTSEQIEMAKNLAKQYGYSDSEIASMVSSQFGSSNSSKSYSTTSGQDDRTSGDLTNSVIQELRSQYKKVGSKILTTDGKVVKFKSKEDSTDFANFLGYQEYRQYQENRRLLGLTEDDTENIYGHALFDNQNLNFIPSYNIPTPSDYQLCPGDQIVIDIWGAVFLYKYFQISSDGTITVDDIGPISVGGHTIAEAQAIVMNRMAETYSGLLGESPNTFLKVSLGQIRTLTVNVVGEAKAPGTYTLPSLSNLFSVLYLAEGPSDFGNVRDIRLYRNNKLMVKLDVYDFLVKGDFSKNIRLQDNDLIKIEPYEVRVQASGAFKRKMMYDMVAGETVADLLKYAAGFADSANTGKIHIVRKQGERAESFDVAASDFGTFVLADGDSLYASSNITDNKNHVCVSGAVWLPGDYAVSEENNSVKSLLGKAGGVREDAFMKWGVINRVDEKHDTVVLHFDVEAVLSGRQDIPLLNKDSVYIFSEQDFYFETPVVTSGELNNPKTIVYRKGMTLGDAILFSGGFSDLANLKDVRVSRRNVDEYRYSKNADSASVTYVFDVRMNAADMTFELEPYDIVIVGRVPNYRQQRLVAVVGEVTSPGSYVLENKDERLSSLLARSGGFTNYAYPQGCRIERYLTELEKDRLMKAMRYAQLQLKDTTAFAGMDLNSSFTVAVDVEKAMKNPGSYADLKLRDGDILIVPEYNPVVRISGTVASANVAPYTPGAGYKNYINQAGGYAQRAYKRGVYIQYANGSISTKKSRGGLKVAPGCEIIVPGKGAAHKWTPAEIMSLTTSAVSLSTMIVSLVNLIKK